MPHASPARGYSFPESKWTLTFNGLLFDMDGTIIDSTAAIIKHWHKLGDELGVDPNIILATSHGRRSVDVLKEYDESKANWDYVLRMEGDIPRQFRDDAVELPGSRELLERLEAAGVPWAIVTSGTRPLLTGWLDVMKLAHPRHLVTAEDVPNGKPDPAGYLLGCEKLGVAGAQASMLVLEDAPAGVRAGKAAGFTVCALATTHTIEQLRDAGADFIVRDLRSVRMQAWDAQTGTVRILIEDAIKLA